MNLKIYCDGGAIGNPGPAAVGVIIKLKTKNEKLKTYEEKTIHSFGKRIGHATNNIAEYMGVIEALKHIKFSIFNFSAKGGPRSAGQFSIKQIDFHLDSKLVVNQLNGVFKVKNPKLRELVLKIRNLEQEINAEIFYHYIPREKNIAHHLVEEGFRL